MDQVRRFLGKKLPPRSPDLPQKPLTPQEIEALHAQLHPETHVDPAAVWASKQVATRPDWRTLYPEPLSESTFISSKKPINPQLQSPVFSRLPREVRQQIWAHLLGHMKLYITAKNKEWKQAEQIDDYGWWKKWWLLDVPMTCRLAYLESVSLLYTTNTFCIGFGAGGTKQPLTQMPSMLREHQIKLIRHVELGWHFARGYTNYYDSHSQAWDPSETICAPDNHEDWRAACAQLAKLPGLRTLKIVVWTSGLERTENKNEEEELLKPLVGLKHLKRFDVLLPWEQDNVDLWKDAPFKVSRKFVDKIRFNVCVPLEEDGTQVNSKEESKKIERPVIPGWSYQ